MSYQQHLVLSVPPETPCLASHMTFKFPTGVQPGHTLRQGGGLGWANGAAGGTCLQVLHHADKWLFPLGNYLKRGLAVILGKGFGCVWMSYCQRGFTYVYPVQRDGCRRLRPDSGDRFPLEVASASFQRLTPPLLHIPGQCCS